MSRQKQNSSSERLQELISRVDSSCNTNRIKLLEPPQPIQQLPKKSS
ncbi:MULTISPECIES: hypothetical protein [Nostocales]|uniref:Uncharacterized protein n=3 Tax=Nostocales TaxID=1161 RepID=A0A8S9TA62_9CYAN|nr:hypothetical protein [Tolypothrix bouteillei]KAF3888522.1 hypothetical protein DA73_0400025860 [Tolypothrix bouteillei VB521301]